MKKLKKLLTFTIVISMICGLVACGNKTTEDKKEDNNNDTDVKTEVNVTTDNKDNNEISKEETKEVEPIVEAEVGAILDAPERMFNADKFYALINFPDDTNESGISTREIVLDDTLTPSVVYLTSGLLKLDEAIYEMDDDGEVTIYAKDVFMEDYVLVENLTDDEKEDQVQYVHSQLSWVGWCSDVYYEGVQYKKCENEWNAFFGDVFVYEMMYEGEMIGKIQVDMETGVWVQEEIDGEETMSVTIFKEDDLGIPEYK